VPGEVEGSQEGNEPTVMSFDAAHVPIKKRILTYVDSYDCNRGGSRALAKRGSTAYKEPLQLSI